MVPRFRRIVFVAYVLCGAALLAQDTPQPIPSMEEPAMVRRVEPQVAYADGKVRVTARQATLGDILEAIRSRSGAAVSAPPEIAAQLINVKLGPAPLLDVLTDLLEAADCNYVVIGSAQKPSSIRISITSKPSDVELTAFERQVANTLSAPGNTPDPSIVTLPATTNESELVSVLKDSDKQETTPPAENATEQQTVSAPK